MPVSSPRRGSADERGVTFVELAFAGLLLGLVALGLIKVFDITGRGGVSMRGEVRATALAQGKLDDMKELARRSSMGGVFDRITQSTLAAAYASPTAAVIAGQPFTWSVNAIYALQSTTTVVDVASTTIPTSLIHFRALVQWRDKGQAQSLTLEALVADQAQ